MSARTWAAGIVTALWVFAGTSQAIYAEPLRIGINTWVGFGPLYVAQEKGFFIDEGVDVHIIKHEEGTYPALFDRQIDAMTAAFLSVVAQRAPGGRAIVCPLAFDESAGGDGIVATHDIKSIADLKGKTVAFDEDTPSEFYLHVLLGEVGLSAADIEAIVLDAQDAAEAFMLQEVDAAVTWEPYLTTANNTEHGHLLADSSNHPGLIVDGLCALADVLDLRREEFAALARAWDRAVAFVETHPDEAIEIMARSVGGWLEDPAEFAAAMEGVRLYDKARNQAYFGTSENPGGIYEMIQHAIEVSSKLGRLQNPDMTPSDLIVHGIWD